MGLLKNANRATIPIRLLVNVYKIAAPLVKKEIQSLVSASQLLLIRLAHPVSIETIQLANVC